MSASAMATSPLPMAWDRTAAPISSRKRRSRRRRYSDTTPAPEKTVASERARRIDAVRGSALTRGISRGMSEAHLVWQTIPESLRATGPEAVAKHLKGLDWSHIVPFSADGSNDASNGIFESAGLNRARGARAMTPKEIQVAHRVLQGKAFSAALSATASRMFAGAVVAAASGCVLATLEHGLEWQQGQIDRGEMIRRIARATGKSAGSGAAVSGLMVAMALAFPPLIPLATHLAIPLAVMGFCTTGHKAVRLGVGWYEVLREPCARQAPSAFKPVMALPPPTRDQESIVGQLARLEGARAG